MIAPIEQPNSPAGIAAAAALKDRTPMVSQQAEREFLVKGDEAALLEFMVERGAVMRPDPTDIAVGLLMDRGLSDDDAKVVGAGAEGGVSTLTRDKRILSRVPELSEGF